MKILKNPFVFSPNFSVITNFLNVIRNDTMVFMEVENVNLFWKELLDVKLTSKYEILKLQLKLFIITTGYVAKASLLFTPYPFIFS